ncbi:hypothetical protein CC79DRAFT_1308934 [Sarocladium strictum]
MEGPGPNSLLSTQTGSDLQVILHPLVLLTISDYITRHTLRQHKGPIIGALLGKHDGREITAEFAFDCHVISAEVEGGFLLHDGMFADRLEQMKLVHKDRQLDLVGWYSLVPAEGPSPTILPIHTQLLQGYNESAILLGFHPKEAADHSVGGKLPLTIYESNYEVDEVKGRQDGEDKKMDDGEPPLKLKFREISYSVETDETEMISMNYIAGSGGNAAASGAVKSEKPGAASTDANGKGKRKLGEDDSDLESGRTSPDEITLSREDDEMIAAMTAKANAIKMLQSRIQLLITYLKGLPPGFDGTMTKSEDEAMNADASTPSHTILRQVQALVSRMDLAIPSDEAAFNEELLHESNDVHLIGLLNGLMQSVSEAKKVGKKFDIVEKSKNTRQRGMDFYVTTNLAGAGDIMM